MLPKLGEQRAEGDEFGELPQVAPLAAYVAQLQIIFEKIDKH